MGRPKGSHNTSKLPPAVIFTETERLQLIADLILDLLSETDLAEK